jgi:hypothetical protein
VALVTVATETPRDCWHSASRSAHRSFSPPTRGPARRCTWHLRRPSKESVASTSSSASQVSPQERPGTMRRLDDYGRSARNSLDQCEAGKRSTVRTGSRRTRSCGPRLSWWLQGRGCFLTTENVAPVHRRGGIHGAAVALVSRRCRRGPPKALLGPVHAAGAGGVLQTSARN